MNKEIIKIFEDSAQVKVSFARENADKIVEVVHLIAQAFREGRKVLLFGNGGSATDAIVIPKLAAAIAAPRGRGYH